MDEKRAMGLLKKSRGQAILQTIKRNRQDQDAVFCMYKRFFLVAFDEEDIIQRDIVDAFGGYDLAIRRLGAVLMARDGKCAHGGLLFILRQKY